MTTHASIRRAARLAAACATLCLPAAATAQLADASASVLALAGSNTATARGFAAVAANPAGLGMFGSPGFSLALVPLQIRSGIDPIRLSDFADFDGRLIPAQTKEEWLGRVTREGGQTGSIGVQASGFALSAGNFGLQVSTVVSGTLNLSPGVVEGLLFGNAGRTGEPSDLSLTGSSVDAFAISTAALSAGFEVGDGLAVGATVKYSVGHGVLVARSTAGAFTSDPLRVEVDFPSVSIEDDDVDLEQGSGVGVDVGVQLRRDRISLGATLQNLGSTFEWDLAKLVYRNGTAFLDETESRTDFDELPFSSAPASLRTTVEDMTLSPAIALGGAYDASGDLTVSAVLKSRFGDGLDLGPKFRAGVGAEWRSLRVLHLRAGAAVVTDGTELAGGASLVLGPVNLSAAAAVQQGSLDDSVFGQFTLSFGGR